MSSFVSNEFTFTPLSYFYNYGYIESKTNNLDLDNYINSFTKYTFMNYSKQQSPPIS